MVAEEVLDAEAGRFDHDASPCPVYSPGYNSLYPILFGLFARQGHHRIAGLPRIRPAQGGPPAQGDRPAAQALTAPVLRTPKGAAMAEEFLTVDAVVEIPRGSRNKYEFDPDTGAIRLDRVLFSSAHYPGDYGFIPGTRGGDGDPLDVLILVEEPTFPGCRVRVRPIGVLIMQDEKGLDEKILGVPVADPRFAEVADLSDLPHHWLEEVENFFETYKALEGKAVSAEGWKGAREASAVLHRCRQQ